MFDTLSALCAGTATTLLAWALWSMYDELSKKGMMDEIVITESSSGLLKLLLPFARRTGNFMCAIIEPDERGHDYQRTKGFWTKYKANLREKILNAGNPAGMTPNDFIGFIVLGLIGAIAFSVIIGKVRPDFFVPVLLVTLLLAFVAPHHYLRKAVLRRHLVILRSLPYTVDLLTLAVEAGLDFTSALSRIVKKIGNNPLAQEFTIMLREIKMGKARGEAMRDLSQRTNLPDLTSVLAALIQADELGGNLGDALRIQADQQRERRSQYAEKKAMEAPVKMLFPLTVFIFPPTFMLLFTPLMLDLSEKF